MDLKISDQFKLYLTYKLARYFKAPKERLVESIREPTHQIYRYPLLERNFNMNLLWHPTHLDTVHISEWLFGDKFLKSKIYSQFIEAEARLAAEDQLSLRMIVHVKRKDSKGNVFVVYRAEEYYGLGGVFVEGDEENRFVIEPIENYLASEYPLDKYADDFQPDWS